MAKQKIEQLEEMARTMVGDGQKPNLFFVSQEGVIITVTRDFEVAYKEWKKLPRSLETALEDRKFGTICDTSPSDTTGKLETWDDSKSYKQMFG